MIKLICPNLLCRTILSVPAGTRGKDVRCRSCGKVVRVPAKPKLIASAKTVKADAPSTADSGSA